MSLLATAYRVTGFALILGLATVLVVQFATGKISTRGLVHDKNLGSSDSVSPARVQLLASTLVVTSLYAYRVVMSRPSGSLPDIPGVALAFTAASHLTYMIGKAITILSRVGRFPR